MIWISQFIKICGLDMVKLTNTGRLKKVRILVSWVRKKTFKSRLRGVVFPTCWWYFGMILGSIRIKNTCLQWLESSKQGRNSAKASKKIKICSKYSKRACSFTVLAVYPSKLSRNCISRTSNYSKFREDLEFELRFAKNANKGG